MRIIYDNKRFWYFCSVIVVAMLPIFSAMLMGMTQKVSILDLYMPNAINFDWNDEVFYYKQIEGIRDYGLPQGYFGYNESHAKYGTLGAWSPVLYLFFGLYSKIFGWNYMDPIWCNLILLTIAMGVFASRLHLNLKQMLALCALYLVFMPITRFSLLCMAEVIVFFLLILFCAVWFPVKIKQGHVNDSAGRYSWKELSVLYVIVSLLVLMRPYYILLLIPVGYQIFRQTRLKGTIIFNLIFSVGIMTFSLWMNANFCAAYFAPTINMSWMNSFRQGVKAGFSQIMDILFDSFKAFIIQSGIGITGNSIAGGIFVIYLIIMGVFLCEIYRQRYNVDIRRRYGGWFFIFFIMLCTKFLFYIGNGYRHFMGFIIIGILICAIFFPLKTYIGVIFVTMVWCFVIKGEPTCEFLPVTTVEMLSEIEAGEAMLKERVFIEQNADPWENTVIWLYMDDLFIKWQDLYAFPSGIGINLCTKQYVMDNFENLKAKYIMTNIGGDVDLKCLQSEKELLAEYGEVHVWRLH